MLKLQEFALDGEGNFWHHDQQRRTLCRLFVDFISIEFNISLAFEMKTFCGWKLVISESRFSHIVTKCWILWILKIMLLIFKWPACINSLPIYVYVYVNWNVWLFGDAKSSHFRLGLEDYWFAIFRHISYLHPPRTSYLHPSVQQQPESHVLLIQKFEHSDVQVGVQ